MTLQSTEVAAGATEHVGVQSVACAGREGAGEVEAAYIGEKQQRCPMVAERDREQGEEDPRRRRLQRIRDVVPCVAALPSVPAAATALATPDAYGSGGGARAHRRRRGRLGSQRRGGDNCEREMLVMKKRKGRGKGKGWERPDIGKTGRKEGGTHTRRAMGMKERGEAEVGAAVDGVGEKREGRTGREWKEDLGRGEGHSSNAAQAAFDADEEESGGEKGKRGSGGTNSARPQTRSRRPVRRRRVERERAAEGTVRDEGKARRDKGGCEEGRTRRQRGDGRRAAAMKTDDARAGGSECAVEGKGRRQRADELHDVHAVEGTGVTSTGRREVGGGRNARALSAPPVAWFAMEAIQVRNLSTENKPFTNVERMKVLRAACIGIPRAGDKSVLRSGDPSRSARVEIIVACGRRGAGKRDKV
ncbi:hypothetical protein C8J57DRAFT_1222011 [Mycena rebaudengoi]|nr:hypothetical protein C8J57DRAFT_1222011 [Mycena rebaudengoi]